MRVCDLLNCPAGTRIRVTKVAESEAEQAGYINDTEVLMGRTGTVVRLNEAKQLTVEWDEPGTSLHLAGLDEIEVLPSELPPKGGRTDGTD